MSYSFSVRAASKAEAKTKAAAEFAKVLESQPSHVVDLAHAATAADAFIDVLPDDDGRDVILSCSGSVGWRGTWGVDHAVLSAGCSVYASLVDRA